MLPKINSADYDHAKLPKHYDKIVKLKAVF